jgi:hypothetical protein
MPHREKPRDVSEAEEKARIENAPEDEDHGITDKRTAKKTTNTVKNMPNTETDQAHQGMGRKSSKK